MASHRSTSRLRSALRPQRTLIASILLVALMLRALIPAGFMPSGERPFSLEICPEGFPAQLLHNSHHHHHDGGHDGDHQRSISDHCPFGSAPGTALMPSVAVVPVAWTAILAPTAPPAPQPIALRLQRTQQPRAPPTSA